MSTKNWERVAVIENEMKNLNKSNNNQNKILKDIRDKLDYVIEKKADKEEVKSLSARVDKWTYGAIIGIISLLIGAVSFLIKRTLFK